MGENPYIIRLSVRDLVEFVLREGDLDNRKTASAKKEAMQQGSRLHRKIQRRMGSFYHPEVKLTHTVDQEEFQVVIEGRADGVIDEPGGVTIDEIKCTYQDVSYFKEAQQVHLAQAKCYGYFFSLGRELAAITLQVTYCNIETEEIRQFSHTCSFEELEEWFNGLLHEYLKWARYQYLHRERRQASIRALRFPFPYRPGQKELAVDVYRSIKRQKNLYIQAPTGIGKTLSCLFPAIKAIGEEHGDKLFYLTAKTITRSVAEEAFSLLKTQNLYFSNVTITAKDKLCFLEQPSCNPVDCAYAKGHFDRVNDAVFAVIHEQMSIDREIILSYAKQFQVCPFEFCLDITNWVDGIICDYNYVFDPSVKLKRYFSEGAKGSYLFLVDEAHNLVTRAREMFSAGLIKEEVLLTAKVVKGRAPRLTKQLNSLNKIMLEMKRECEHYRTMPEINYMALEVMKLQEEMEKFLDEQAEFADRDLVLDFYFKVRDFALIYEQMDEGYRIYSQMLEDGRFMVRLFCINPSGQLKCCMDQGLSTILFSATLLPMPYYKELLSGEPEGYAIYAKSPFPSHNRLLLIAGDVSSKYTRRNNTEYEKMVSHILQIVNAKKGNYLVFCPSFLYLNEIADRLGAAAGTAGFDLAVQQAHMGEAQREAFLNEFTGARNQSLVGVCVMGGIFSEGIDLKEEHLIGVVVIGTGLPMVGPQQEILKTYFDEQGKNGFSYAYQYPGMNKVMQAAGRVIRTMTDVGVIALLDERFLARDYQLLFPREWADYQVVNRATIGSRLAAFWEAL